MTIAADFSIASNGDIRHVSGTTVYTVLEMHAWLQDLADDASATGNDLVSILSTNPSRLDGPRSAIKPMSLNLLSTFNIDDTAAQFINFGSISQASGGTLYTGVKSIGSPLVAASPVYIVQNAAKLTSYWAAGHIQILVKGKSGGTLIDSGDIRAYSRKYGQTYADFAANLVAGGEQPVAISTALTDWTTLSKSAALALSTKVAIAIGDTTQTLGANTKLYKGTITLSGGITVAEAAQYLQAICDESSTTTINSLEGWRYQKLDASYAANSSAPFGLVAGGKWFVAQGWWVTGVLAGDSQKYQLTSHDGTVCSAPVAASIIIGGLTVGDRLLAGRDDGAGGFLTSEYTLNGATTSVGNTCVVNETIKADTPATGYIRVNGVPYSYTGFVAGTKTFTISGTWGQIHANASPAWVPLIDKVAASSTESTSFTYGADFTGRVKIRNGNIGAPIVPFETTYSVTTGGGGTNLIRTADV